MESWLLLVSSLFNLQSSKIVAFAFLTYSQSVLNVSCFACHAPHWVIMVIAIKATVKQNVPMPWQMFSTPGVRVSNISLWFYGTVLHYREWFLVFCLPWTMPSPWSNLLHLKITLVKWMFYAMCVLKNWQSDIFQHAIKSSLMLL